MKTLPHDLQSLAVPSANTRLSRQALFAFAATAIATNTLAGSSCSGTVGASYGFPGCDDCGTQAYGDAGSGFVDDERLGSPFDAYFYDDSANDDADAGDAGNDDAD